MGDKKLQYIHSNKYGIGTSCYTIERQEGNLYKFTKPGMYDSVIDIFVPESDIGLVIDTIRVKSVNRYGMNGEYKVTEQADGSYIFSKPGGIFSKPVVITVPISHIPELIDTVIKTKPDNKYKIRDKYKIELLTGVYYKFTLGAAPGERENVFYVSEYSIRNGDIETFGPLYIGGPVPPIPTDTAPQCINGYFSQLPVTNVDPHTTAGNTKVGGYRSRKSKKARRNRRRYSRRRRN